MEDIIKEKEIEIIQCLEESCDECCKRCPYIDW